MQGWCLCKTCADHLPVSVCMIARCAAALPLPSHSVAGHRDSTRCDSRIPKRVIITVMAAAVAAAACSEMLTQRPVILRTPQAALSFVLRFVLWSTPAKTDKTFGAMQGTRLSTILSGKQAHATLVVVYAITYTWINNYNATLTAYACRWRCTTLTSYFEFIYTVVLNMQQSMPPHAALHKNHSFQSHSILIPLPGPH